MLVNMRVYVNFCSTEFSKFPPGTITDIVESGNYLNWSSLQFAAITYLTICYASSYKTI